MHWSMYCTVCRDCRNMYRCKKFVTWLQLNWLIYVWSLNLQLNISLLLKQDIWLCSKFCTFSSFSFSLQCASIGINLIVTVHLSLLLNHGNRNKKIKCLICWRGGGHEVTRSVTIDRGIGRRCLEGMEKKRIRWKGVVASRKGAV